MFINKIGFPLVHGVCAILLPGQPLLTTPVGPRRIQYEESGVLQNKGVVVLSCLSNEKALQAER
jgi:hypothetical protein